MGGRRSLSFSVVIVMASIVACGSPPVATSGTAQAVVAVEADDVLTYRGDSSRTGQMPGPGPAKPEVRWTFKADGPIGSSPAVVDGTVLVVSGDGVLHSLDLASGHERWNVPLGAEAGAATPLVVGATAIVGDMAGVVHGVDADDGSERWKATADGPISGAAGASSSLVVAATTKGSAFGIDASTGAIAWRASLPGGVSRSVAVDDDIAYLGAAGGHIVAVRVADGSIAWQARVAQSGEGGTPAVADGLVFAATGYHADDPSAAGVSAVDAATQSVRWRYASPNQDDLFTPAVADGRAFVVGHEFEGRRTGRDLRHAALVADDGRSHRRIAVCRERGCLCCAGRRFGHGVRRRRGNATLAGADRRGPVFARDHGRARARRHEPWPPLRARRRPVIRQRPPTERLFRASHEKHVISGVKEIIMGRVSSTSAVLRCAALSVILAGCGAAAGASASLPAATAAPSIAQSPSAAPTGSVYPEPSPIDPGSVEPEAALDLLWKGTGAESGGWPAHPAIDNEGRIWVGVFEKDEFWVFDRDGKLLDTWDAGSTSATTGHFGGIAFGPDGRIYVVDSGKRRVLMFDAERKPLGEWGSFGTEPDQFLIPNAIVTDADGNVYVNDDEVGVKKFTADGEPLGSFANSYPSVHADGDGHVFAVVGYGPKLLKEYAADGSVVRSIDVSGLAEFAIGIRVDGAGNIWLGSNRETPTGVDADRLLKFGPDGTLLRNWEGVPVDDFAIDPKGDRIYVSFFGQPFVAAYALPSD